LGQERAKGSNPGKASARFGRYISLQMNQERRAMRMMKFCLMTGLAFGLPFAAAAQNVAKGTPSDIKYCNALAKSYSSLYPANEGMSVTDATILTRCDNDPQATIAALARKLKDKKIDLPSDERVAHTPGSTRNTQ
jgi:hypothetical protein